MAVHAACARQAVRLRAPGRNCAASAAAMCVQELLSMAVQTREERERAQAAAARREEAARSKRDQLKQEFLKKQLSKVMAAKKQ